MPMRHKTRRRKRRINLFTRKRIKNVYDFKKMRLVRGGNWLSYLFPETPEYELKKELINAAKNKYLSSNSEPECPDEYLKLRDQLLDNPAYFYMDHPRRSREPRSAENIDADFKKETWRTWAMSLRQATRDAAGLPHVF